MPEDQTLDPAATNADPATPPATPPATSPAAGDPDRLPDDHKVVKAMHDYKTQRDAEKQRRAEVEAELENIRNANLSDTDKAIKEAEERGRKAERESFGTELARARLEAAGVPADKVGDLNLSSVLDAEGKVDAAKVADLAARHKANTTPPPPGSADGGPQGKGDPTKPKQLTRADMAGMTSEQIVEAKANGQFDELLGIT